MTRRNALERLRTHAQDPISSIPLAQVRKRANRSWDQLHHGSSYFIPALLTETAKEVRESILALAQNHSTNTSSVATALISFSLTHVHQGKLAIEARPDAKRRKMALTWAEVDGRPQILPRPARRLAKDGTKNIYLNYRWGRDIDSQIKELASDFVSPGEVVVFLLSYALTAHKNGRLMLKAEPVAVTQKVRSAW